MADDRVTFAEQRDRKEPPKHPDKWLVTAGICALGNEYGLEGAIDNVEYVIEAPSLYVVIEKLDAEILRVQKENGDRAQFRLISINARLLPVPI